MVIILPSRLLRQYNCIRRRQSRDGYRNDRKHDENVALNGRTAGNEWKQAVWRWFARALPVDWENMRVIYTNVCQLRHKHSLSFMVTSCRNIGMSYIHAIYMVSSGSFSLLFSASVSRAGERIENLPPSSNRDALVNKLRTTYYQGGYFVSICIRIKYNSCGGASIMSLSMDHVTYPIISSSSTPASLRRMWGDGWYPAGREICYRTFSIMPIPSLSRATLKELQISFV